MNEAIQNALNPQEGKSISEGNIVVGVSDTHVAISFVNIPSGQNAITCLEKWDARNLLMLLNQVI